MKNRPAILIAAFASLHCGQRPGAIYPEASVVLISIDTLRADRLALYGYRYGRTPSIDALGQDGLVFDDVSSHAPLTLPAHASMFTGLLPPRHEVRDNIGFRLRESHRTLAERFRAAGFATGGAVSSYVLRSQTGISRGFEMYDDALVVSAGAESLGDLQREGGIAVTSLLKFVQAQGQKRFFAFLHLYEPHSPWSPPEPYRDLNSPYDGEVASADALVGRFLDGLRLMGLSDRLIVALTSDHGEGLGDHGEQEHGLLLYREAIHVPLVLRLPDRAGHGSRVSGPVAQVDIAPTLLDLAGVASEGMDGISLRSVLESGTVGPREVYSETLYPRYHFGWSDLYASADGRFRFIRAPRPELYDLSKDPGEKANLFAARPQVAAVMDAWLAKTAGAAGAPEPVDAQTREKLAALGYVGSSPGPLVSGSALADPKDKIAAYEELRKGLALRASGRDEEAVVGLRQVLRDNPLMLDAWESLGLSLISLGRDREGIEALNRAVKLDPLRAEPHMALAKLYAVEGKVDAAIAHAEIASRKDPGKSFELLAQVTMDRHREVEAAAFARRSIAADPERGMSHFILGVLSRQRGRCEDAVASFRRASEAVARARGSAIRSLHFQMGDCLARLGQETEAEKEFLEELKTLPRSIEARVAVAMLYRSQSRDQEARAILGGLVDGDTAATPEAYWAVVKTFTVLGDREAARSFAAVARARFPADTRFR